MRVTLIILLFLSTAACQKSTCDSLGARADTCDTARGRYVEREQALCTVVRNELGQNTFDPFASCITGASCEAANTFQSCQQEHIPAASEDPCLRFKLWASSCSLEPSGTEDNCGGLSSGLTSELFSSWVDCMTTDGCPAQTDNRYAACQEFIVPSGVTDALEACGLLVEWTEDCSDETSGALAVDSQSVAACMLQLELFTGASMLTYAQCLQDVECNDLAMRLQCLSELRFQQDSPIESQCESLINFAQSCEIELNVESVDVCVRFFAPFTPASFETYVTCMTGSGCEGVDAATCSSLLVLSSPNP